MISFIMVGLGGLLGSLARYGVSLWIKPGGGFFTSTLAVNLAGSFLIAVIISLAEKKSGWIQNDFRLFLTAGFCGGFTTFSALMLEFMELVRTASYAQAGFYLSASVIGGCLAFLIGFYLIHKFF